MSLYPELAALDLDELKRLFEQQKDEEEYDDIYYEEVAQYILTWGEDGLAYLRNVVEEDRIDVFTLRAALCMLGFQPQGPWYREKLHALLQDTREPLIAEAVDSLAHIGARDLAQEVLRLRDHPSPYVRAGVLRYMTRLFPDEALPMLLAALKDEHPIVQENAIDELDDLGYYQAIPVIRPFLSAEQDVVREAAEWAMENLTSIRDEQESSGTSINEEESN